MPVMIRRRELMTAIGSAATWPFVATPALAQGWPARSVRVVVPYAPGGFYRHGRPHYCRPAVADLGATGGD
jgi:hypothetical protein